MPPNEIFERGGWIRRFKRGHIRDERIALRALTLGSTARVVSEGAKTRLALRRLRGLPSNKAVLTAAREVAAAAERDGHRVVRREGQPVIYVLSYDLKVGFNAREELSMAVWLSMPRPLMHNEVGVLLEQHGSE